MGDIVEAFSASHRRPHIQIIDDVIFAIPGEDPLKSCLTDYAQERGVFFWRTFRKVQRGESRNRKLKAFLSRL